MNYGDINKEFNAGDLILQSWTVFKKYFVRIILIVFIINLPVYILGTIVGPLAGRFAEIFAVCIIALTISKLVTGELLSKPVTLSESLKESMFKLPTAFLTTVLLGILFLLGFTLLGFKLFILPAVIIYFYLQLVFPIMVNRNYYFIKAYLYSKSLISLKIVDVFLFYLFFLFIAIIISLLLGLVLMFFPYPKYWNIVYSLFILFLSQYVIVFETVIFINLENIKNRMNDTERHLETGKEENLAP